LLEESQKLVFVVIVVMDQKIAEDRIAVLQTVFKFEDQSIEMKLFTNWIFFGK